MPPSIYDFIKQQESAYETQEISVGDNWYWKMREHIQLIFHLKNSVFYTGENDWLRAFKNIMEPILSLCYWTEDIEVKDVVFSTGEEDDRVLSFLLKKYQEEVYTKDHNLDELFDEITESDLDYGGVLVQKGVEMPEVLPLQSVKFCDQTNALGSPIAFGHFFSPAKLREMSKFGWGDPKNGATISLEDLCVLASADKISATLGERKNLVPGKNIEVYIVRGNMPDAYLNDSNDMEYYCNQLQIVAFYTKKDSTKEGVTLYRKKEDEGNLKFFTSQKVYQRALGRGVGETIIHPQIWTNWDTIQKNNLLEAGAKVVLYTDDPSYTTKNKIQDMENLEITTIEDGKQIRQVPTIGAANIQLFERSVEEWYQQAQLLGAAFDPIMGKQPVSGTTFRGQERNVAQGKGSHERRMGKRAKFIEEIYRDFILPDMRKEILKGKKFLASLSIEEMEWLSEQVAVNVVNEHIKDLILAGETITPELQQQLTQQMQQDMQKKGRKQMIEILKDEFAEMEISVSVNVANKKKDLVGMVDQLTHIFQVISANPYLIKSPPMQKLFNQIVEAMGLEPIDLSGFNVPPMPTRRMTETIAYDDLGKAPPNDAQKQMLELAGIQTNQQFAPPPTVTK